MTRAAHLDAGYWHSSLLRLRADRFGLAAGLVIVAIAMFGLLAPPISQVLGQYPDRQDLLATFRPPSAENLLGTDELGRDTLIRLIYGTRVSLGVSALTVTLALALGTGVGLLAGFHRGFVDEVLMRLVDTLLAIPAIFLFIFMSILFRPEALMLAVMIASIRWVPVARLVRGEAIALRVRDFVMAAQIVGCTSGRIMFRHLLPNLVPTISVYTSLATAQVILVQASLDFLGLGIAPPTPSWGNMLTNSQSYFHHSPWLVIWPGALIFITVLAMNLFGNSLRDAFDPRTR